MKKIRFFVILLLALLILFPGIALGANAVPQEVLDARESIVRIICGYSFDDKIIVTSGTGFAIGTESPIEYIATNYHVIQGNPHIIKVFLSDSISTEATVYRSIENSDVCILKLDNPIYELPPVTIEDLTEPKAGDPIDTLGFPGTADEIEEDVALNIEDITITDGIISALKSSSLIDGGPDRELIQINAAISHGNSGGPLLNENGHIIGINTLAFGDDINVAVSIKELIPLLTSNNIAYLSSAAIEEEKLEETPAPIATIEPEVTAVLGAATESQEPPPADTSSLIIFISVGVVLLAVICFMLFFLLRRRKKVYSYNDYFMACNLSLDAKLYAFLPLIRKVRELHNKGKHNLDICPQNISVNSSGAVLSVKNALSKSQGALLIRPGYSAPEHYSTDKMKGPWTDIYSLSAALYNIITGKTLAPAYEASKEKVPDFGGELDDKYKNLIETIKKGLEPEYQKRAVSTDELINQIQACLIKYESSALESGESTTAENTAGSHTDFSAHKIPRFKLSRKAAVISLISVALVILAFGILLITSESSYVTATNYIVEGEYAKAEESLKGALSFYKDSQKLSRYIRAGLYLKSNEFEKAKKIYENLDDFKDAADMVSETDYLYAKYLVENSSFESAKKMFIELGDYKDSKDMVMGVDLAEAQSYIEKGKFDTAEKMLNELAGSGYEKAEDLLPEISYQKALLNIGEEDWISAISELEAIGEYKDSKDKLETIKEDLYVEALDFFENKEYDFAKENLEIITGYKQADDYIGLIPLLIIIDDKEELTKDEYETFMSYSGLINVSEYVLKDSVIFWFLIGYWEDSSGDYRFEMSYDKDKDHWSAWDSFTNWDGDFYYDIEDAKFIIYSEEDDSAHDLYEFEFEGMDTIRVYCYEDDKTYTLHRE